MKKITKGMILPYGIDAYLYQQVPSKTLMITSSKELEVIGRSLIKRGKKFCVRGAGTGYAGAAIPLTKDELIIKLGIDKILKIDAKTRSIEVEAGVTPSVINESVCNYNLFYPPDPASFRVCTIGGNIATNAGGPHCYMYGVTSNYIEKIKVFLPNNKKFFIIGAVSPYSLIYDLKDLFIGSEGTLGIFSQAKLKLRLKPPHVYTYLIEFDNYGNAIKFINELILNGLVLAALDMSSEPFIPSKHPLNKIGAKLLISIHGGDIYIEYSKKILAKLIKKYASNYIEGESEKLMKMRTELVKQNVRNVIKESGKSQYFLFDAVVPRSRLKDILDYLYSLADKNGLPLMNTFHAGDGNIHPTLFYDPECREDLEKLRCFWYAVLKKVIELNGSITGEHGIGIEKREIFSYYEDETILKIHEAIKTFFDPQRLLCNGKIFIEDKDALRKKIKELDLLLTKYGLDNIKVDNTNDSEEQVIKKENQCLYEQEILDGVIEVSNDEKIDKINERLKKYKYFVPYFPMIFPKKSISFLIKHNIPNLYSHIFELRDIIIGAIFDYHNKKVIVGRKVLKNVAGYSLKFLNHYAEVLGKPKSYFIKIIPETSKKFQYISISFSLRSANSTNLLDRIIDIIYKKALNVIVHKSENEYKINAIIHNDKLHISSVSRILNSKNIHYELKPEIDIPYLNSKKFLIIGLSGVVQIKTLAQLGKGYIYSILSNTLILPIYNNEYEELTKKILASHLSSKIESIRLVSKNGCEKHLFLSKELNCQVKVTEKLVKHILDFVSKPHKKEDSGVEISTIPLIKFLPTSPPIDKEIKNEIKKCTRCGLCLSVCPLYIEKRDEIFSPRGFLTLLSSGNAKEDYINEFVQYCLNSCKANKPCEDACPVGISFSKILDKIKKSDWHGCSNTSKRVNKNKE